MKDREPSVCVILRALRDDLQARVKQATIDAGTAYETTNPRDAKNSDVRYFVGAAENLSDFLIKLEFAIQDAERIAGSGMKKHIREMHDNENEDCALNDPETFASPAAALRMHELLLEARDALCVIDTEYVGQLIDSIDELTNTLESEI